MGLWTGRDFLIPNKRKAKCKTCGKEAVLEVTPDGWYDPPESFTVRITCSGQCEKVYVSLTPKQMHEKTGQPLTGWLPN